jgi:metallo-beta-lactamase family protein
MGSLSAHADSEEVIRWLRGFKRPPRTTFIVHGEPDGAQALRDKITSELSWNAVIPTYKELVAL